MYINQDIIPTQEGTHLERTEITEDTEKKGMVQIGAQVGIEEEGPVLIEPRSMATGSTHEGAARRFQTWGSLR